MIIFSDIIKASAIIAAIIIAAAIVCIIVFLIHDYVDWLRDIGTKLGWWK